MAEEMASAVDKEAGAANSSTGQRRKLQKAFKHLKSHASAVANFTLQWQDLEDYILSVQHQIESRLSQLQSPTTVKLESREQIVAAPGAQNKGIPESGVRETARSSPSRGNSGTISFKDGKSLLLHLIDSMKDHKVIRQDARVALAGLENCGKVVLEAMREYVHSGESLNGKISIDVAAARKICNVLIQELMRIVPEVGEQVKEDARRLAVEWKEKLETNEANMFLKYLQAYGLVGDFKEDEIFQILKDLLYRSDATEIFRSLGLGHKAADFIEKLIAWKKRIEAVRFIYSFELVNQFSPIPLIKEHLDWAKKEAALACRGGNRAEAWVEAANLECSALCAAMGCIQNHNLQSHFPTEALTRRIIQLRKHRTNSKKLASNSQSKTQSQQHSGNKRLSSDNLAHHNKQIGNKRHQAAIPEGSSQGARLGPPSYSVNPIQQVHGSHVEAAITTPNTAIDAPFSRILVPPTHLQPPPPYLSQGINISQATGENGATTIRNSTLSPRNLRQPLQLSARGVNSSLMSNVSNSVIDGVPSVRNPIVSPSDLLPRRELLSQYADVPYDPLMDSFPASRQPHFMGSIRETEGMNLTSGYYRSTGLSVVPPRKISPTANSGDGTSTTDRLFTEDDLAGIRSDIAAISAMKHRIAGSSSFSYADDIPRVSSTVPRSRHYFQTHGYSARPSSYDYND